MFARYAIATGALIADMIAEPPAPAEGVGVVEMPPSAVAGLTVWSVKALGYVDPPPPLPPPSAFDALVALLVAKAVITQPEADALAPQV
jgi:hypothetical protein